MLAKKNRLTRVQFSEFFSKGKRLHTPLFTAVYCSNPSFKASAVISKKIEKSAVARNKFRRRIYAIFETYMQQQPLQGIFICIAKKEGATAQFASIKRELLAVIHKTSVLG